MHMQLIGISLQCNIIQKKKKRKKEKKKWAIDTHYNMDESPKNYPEWKKSDRKVYTVWLHLCKRLEEAN